ncbi:hypothetical protein [Mycobacterium sp.]|uniref:hypothetical protein n=1 Tax=Mycobacterium sp. TaxID=1785 RepID=UPI003D0E4BBD
MNHAIFEHLYISDDEIVDIELTELFDSLLDPNLKDRLDHELTSISPLPAAKAKTTPR